MFNTPPTKKQLTSCPLIQLWLLAICFLIFVMVIIGGATRLTGSGLSITEWKPIMGAIPPLNGQDWQEAFEKYKQIPQYTEINEGMSLDEFKSIFWWEWGHRFLGRFIGLAFFIPFLIFLLSKRVEACLQPKLLVMFLLGGLQGFMGWYMVTSGLVDRVDVSQYRLAAHLGLAVLIFGYIFWIVLGLNNRANTEPVNSKIKWGAIGLVCLIFIQIIAGAFVAGLKAGKSHNSWPLMDGEWIPTGLTIMTPWWKNLFENALTVQFDHRIIAYIIVAMLIWHLFSIFKAGEQRGKSSGVTLLILTLLQITLGILTLLYFVPLKLALIHQAGAIIVFAVALWHLHRLITSDAMNQTN